ncbi:hypothetical protein C0993_003833, partial [Termitomyces sp. T159_Od127]
RQVGVSRPATDPRDSNPPKTTPTTAPGPDHYPANSLGNPRPSPAITACRRHQPPPPVASPAITGHHRPSLPQPRHPPAITAVTATSAPVSAITPPIAATSAPAPPVTPGPHQDPHHASQSCITAADLRTPCPAPAPSSPHHHDVSLRFQYETSTLRDMSQPCPAPCGPRVSPQALVP